MADDKKDSDLSKVKSSFFNYETKFPSLLDMFKGETEEEKKKRLEEEAEKKRKEDEESEARVERGEGSLAETVTSKLKRLQEQGFPSKNYKKPKKDEE